MSVKIGISIPLKAKSVSKDWAVTCKNAEATVNSILAQKDTRYEALVVGHDVPEFMEQQDASAKCKFIHIGDLQPPVPGADESKNQLLYEADRCSKILKGIYELKTRCPDITHWFALDADDLLHKHFVQSILSYKDADAIVLDNGYFYFKNVDSIVLEDEFSAYCGSSTVLADRTINLPSPFHVEDYRSIPYGSISHVHMKEKLISQGFHVKVPTERLIMYVRDNGENISNAAYCNTLIRKAKKQVKVLLKGRRPSEEIRACFGI